MIWYHGKICLSAFAHGILQSASRLNSIGQQVNKKMGWMADKGKGVSVLMYQLEI
jgi:hypothetical protein